MGEKSFFYFLKGRKMTWLDCVDDQNDHHVALNVDQVVVMWIEECDPHKTAMSKDRIKPKWMLKLQTAARTYTYAPPTAWTEERQAQDMLMNLTALSSKLAAVRLRPRG